MPVTHHDSGEMTEGAYGHSMELGHYPERCSKMLPFLSKIVTFPKYGRTTRMEGGTSPRSSRRRPTETEAAKPRNTKSSVVEIGVEGEDKEKGVRRGCPGIRSGGAGHRENTPQPWNPT
jgi:hypothetical protein